MATSNCLHLWKKNILFSSIIYLSQKPQSGNIFTNECKRKQNETKHNEKYVYKEMRSKFEYLSFHSTSLIKYGFSQVKPNITLKIFAPQVQFL